MTAHTHFCAQFVRCVALILLLAHSSTPQSTLFQSVLQYYRNSLRLPIGATTDSNKFQKEYDFVVVGAGSGGSVVANRLTENPDWSVLLLEAGKEELILTDVPLLVSYILATDFNWGYRTEPNEGICLSMVEKRCKWHRGKAMGGTSVINYMVYSRGVPRDYNNWASLGNYGWSFRDVLPYFRKSEDMVVPELRNSPYHGTGGYLTVDRPKWRTPLVSAFMKAGVQMGYPLLDVNGENPLGFDYILATTRRGARLSASKAFLRPIRTRKNFTVGKQARVTRIIIDPVTNRTIGVEFLKNRKIHVVRARKEVVLCAGALNSPQLLMLSGVGPRDHLEEMGIPVIKDLRVGYNLQDHVSMGGLAFLVNDTVSIIESRYQGPQYMLDYLLNGAGPLTLPGGAEALALFRTGLVDGPEDHPDMELVFGPGALTGDTGASLRRSFAIREDFYDKVYRAHEGEDAFSIVPVLLQPLSRGRVKLKSRNPFHWPLLYPNYYDHPRDLKIVVEGIKMAVRITETEPFAKYATQLLRNPFPGCASLIFASDEYWACTARHITTNLQHQSGTCKMGPPSDPEAVVDPQLRVYGIQGLRVVDASIMPVIPAGHTNAIVFMIGEKAADLIKDTWSTNEVDARRKRMS
ncbi:glucose dehydrogenase [FAD, quinone]-like [Nilaparvata lugens]|uniref:glucose dehydrogenase [FAD, quinone]-like n=1 Tax=Nilaparvata lugens TaxID=108931 RepID=UPI00193E6404|nr:glucose dehydrogenase [FAD, quinone]-like [Nilaparvata lugens]